MSHADLYPPAVTLDTRGRSCPGPVIEAKRRAGELAPGEVLLLLSDCPGTHSDLQAWARLTGRELLAVEARDGGVTAFYVRNGDPWPASAVVDTRGRPCPAPVIEAERHLHAMAAGEVLKLLSDCRGFSDDLLTWARNTGRQVLGTVPGPAGSQAAFIRS